MLVAQYIISVLVTWVVIAGGILVHKYIPLADLQVGEALAAEAEREIAAKQESPTMLSGWPRTFTPN